MKNVKNWSIIVLTVFVLILAWRVQNITEKRNQDRADKERWQSNYLEQTKIYLTQKEWLRLKNDTINLLSARTERLIDSLTLKPKTITKIVERVIIQKEIDTVIVEGTKIAKGTYMIYDSGPCFAWRGIASIFSEDSLSVKRTGFLYENNITEIELNRKEKGKFLFWKTYYRNTADVKVIPECGSQVVKTISISK